MVLFNRLFGHKKKQNTPSVSDAIEQLRGTQNILMKKHDFLEAKIATQFELARKYGTKNKREAMAALRTKKKYELELQRTEGTLNTVQNQISNLENASVNAEILKVMSNASKTLKTTYNGMDVDKVHDLVDEIDEQREMVDEIANALSTQYGPSAVDEDDLLAELDALEQESLDRQLLEAPDPVGQVSKSKTKPSSEEELSQLRAWASS